MAHALDKVRHAGRHAFHSSLWLLGRRDCDRIGEHRPDSRESLESDSEGHEQINVLQLTVVLLNQAGE